MIVIARMIVILSFVVITACFDKNKEIIGLLALALLILAIGCA